MYSLLFIKEILGELKNKAQESIITEIKITFMMDNGLMIQNKVMAYINLHNNFMKDFGRKIKNMEKEVYLIKRIILNLMADFMMIFLQMDRLNIQMEICIQVLFI